MRITITPVNVSIGATNNKIIIYTSGCITGSSGGGTWGTITGTLSDQTDLNTALGLKVDKVTGKGLSTNDYTTAEQSRLSGIETGAQVNIIETVKVNGVALVPTSKAVDIPVPEAQIQSDWNQSTNTALDYIKNKPTILQKLTASVTIAVADWSGGLTCTKTVTGLLSTDSVTPAMTRANLLLYGTAIITADSSVNGQITFTASTTPTSQIVVPLEILR